MLRSARLRIPPHPRPFSAPGPLRAITTIPTSGGPIAPPPPLPTPAAAAITRCPPKPIGDISSIFPSLYSKRPPNSSLPARFAAIKSSLLACTPSQLQSSFDSLVNSLESEIAHIQEHGSSVVPTVEFSDLKSAARDATTLAEIQKRGTIVIKNVIPKDEALELKASVRDYIAKNQGRVKAFPPGPSPSVYEIYFSPAQIRARTHPSILSVQRFLIHSLWGGGSASQPLEGIDTLTPLSYADRLRIRPPGDVQFSLGPHVDAGGVERWEDPTYSSVYASIFSGNWHSYDPFSRAAILLREKAALDMYNSPGGCSALRLWQGWLGLSSTGPGEGTLRVYPLLKHSTAYLMLRPFFRPVREGDLNGPWTFADPVTPDLPGAIPTFVQEFSESTHPHLQLSKAMVSVPKVEPGDYVAWHCDEIHALEKRHNGKQDSSVLYIPAIPWSPRNVEYVKRQRDAMEMGGVAPDFPGAGVEGCGEKGWEGQGGWQHVHEGSGEEGKRALGWGLVKRAFGMGN
ncbi:hypothetical protein BDZ91DRAFT_782497 [Kalaharituber pfeilii]|nr:hypothetical protein BDZ91DRAFT_782497 [Kalaharituber pfeilii]